MLAEKERDFQPHLVSLETLVPEDNFYRRLGSRAKLSYRFSWIYGVVPLRTNAMSL